jgi:hypothetical protein
MAGSLAGGTGKSKVERGASKVGIIGGKAIRDVLAE